MYCSACGKKCPEGAVYCAWCGAKLPELAPGQPEPSAPVAAEPEDIPEQPVPAVDSPVHAAVEAKSGVPEATAQPEPEQLDLDLDLDELEELEEDEPAAPAPGPQKAVPAHHVFQRPQGLFTHTDEAQTVRPLAANPAQPLRGAEAAAVATVASEPVEEISLDELDGPDLADDAPAKRDDRKSTRYDEGDEWVHPARDKASRAARNEREDERSAKRSPYEREDERSAKRSPYEREDERPQKRSLFEREADKPGKRSPFERENERPQKRSPFERESERPLKHAAYDQDDDLPVRSARGKAERPKPLGSARGKAVTASGGMVTPPARRSPTRQSSPFQPPKQAKKDLFFEDLETPAENFYDEAVEDRALARRIKAIVAIALVAGIAMVAIWLMWTPGGQMVRAQMNLGAPASAYKALGDQDRANGQIQRAADAYYNALRLDQSNYEYALLVAQTQDMIGNRENAVKAYKKCVVLKPTEAEPYKQLVELYKVMGDAQAAENYRAEGYKQTADASLAPGT